MQAKEEILDRIKQALRDVPSGERPGDVPVKREYRTAGSGTREEVAALFAERVSEYEARVSRISSGQLKETIAASCRREQVGKLVVPEGIAEEILPEGVEFLRDDSSQPLTHRELDASDGVLTGSALAAAQTGTIFLDGGDGQGRRALTLLPDYHLCIVREDRIVETFPEAIAHFEESILKDSPALTLVSGPSATSDIELNRVEGVHGPRRLEVLVVGVG